MKFSSMTTTSSPAHHHTTCVRVELVHDVTKKCRFSQSESSILDRLAFTSEIAIGTCTLFSPICQLFGTCNTEEHQSIIRLLLAVYYVDT